MYASLRADRSIPMFCAVVRAMKRVFSEEQGSCIEQYGTMREVPDVEVDSNLEMDRATSPVQPERLGEKYREVEAFRDTGMRDGRERGAVRNTR